MGNKLELVEKAYYVWHKDMLGYGPEIFNSYDEVPPTYAKSPGMAKSYPSEAYDWELDGEYPKYLQLNVRRAKDWDKVRLDGKVTVRFRALEDIERNKKVEKRRLLVETYPDDTMFYIQRGYVGNSVLWWGLNSVDYTCKIEKSQTYTKKEVLERFLDGNPDDRIWPADHVNKNTCLVVDGQHLNGSLVI